MADDIVERLRAKDVLTNIIRSCQVIPGRHPGELADLMEEAADEIERLRLALHDIYEVYAGSEGIPEPVTCPEAYLLSLLQQMVEIAAEHKK